MVKFKNLRTREFLIVSAPYRCYVKNMGESRQRCSQHLGINEEKLLYEQSSKTNAVQLTMELQTTNAHSNEMPKKIRKFKKTTATVPC